MSKPSGPKVEEEAVFCILFLLVFCLMIWERGIGGFIYNGGWGV